MLIQNVPMVKKGPETPLAHTRHQTNISRAHICCAAIQTNPGGNIPAPPPTLHFTYLTRDPSVTNTD